MANNYFDGRSIRAARQFHRGESYATASGVEPGLKGKIDRFGSDPDGFSRFLIGTLCAVQNRGPTCSRSNDCA